MISLASQPLSLVDLLRFRRIYCTSTSLVIQGVLTWITLGVTWYLFCQTHKICIFLENLLRLLWEFSGSMYWRVLGVLWRDFLAHSGRSLARLPEYLLLGAILFVGRSQWPCKPLGTGLFVWYRVCFLTLFIGFSWITSCTDQVACRNH